MKCFSAKIVLWAILFSAAAYGKVFHIMPVEENKIGPGDIVTVKVEAATEDGEELPNFTGQRLGNFLYVMDQKGNLLDVIVAPADKKNEGGAESEGDKFVLKGFEFQRKEAKSAREYLVENLNYSPNQNKLWVFALAGFLLVIIFIWGTKFAIGKKREKALRRKKLEEARELMLLVKNSEKREDFERIFELKKDVREKLDYNEKAFLKFIQKLDDVQFKRNWSQEEALQIKQRFLDFQKTLKVKSGI